jgi:hypothetical protein
MKVRDPRGRLLLVAIAAVPMLAGASARPLNPLVTRAAMVNGPVPVECEEGMSDTPALRVQVAELPPPDTTAVDLAPPPTRALRAELKDAQEALVRNDRAAFDSHLHAAREIAASYPPGAERRGAEEVLDVYDATSRVWNAQFETPFFDQSSDAYLAANAYPGYEDAVRRQVLVDDRDRRFYPAAETRDFLASVAQSRLQRLGISTSAPPTRIARVMAPEHDEDEELRPLPNVQPRRTPRAASVSANTTHRRSSSHRTKSKPMPAALHVQPKPDSPDRPAHVAAAAPAPAAPPPVAVPTPASTAPALPAAGEISTQPPAPETAMTETTAPETTSSESTTTSVSTPSTSRSIAIPAALILIGLGVLIVLFRASK